MQGDLTLFDNLHFYDMEDNIIFIFKRITINVLCAYFCNESLTHLVFCVCEYR